MMRIRCGSTERSPVRVQAAISQAPRDCDQLVNPEISTVSIECKLAIELEYNQSRVKIGGRISLSGRLTRR